MLSSPFACYPLFVISIHTNTDTSKAVCGTPESQPSYLDPDIVCLIK